MADINFNETPVNYNDIPDPEWGQEVAKWPWVLIYNDPPIIIWGKEGICPYCKDHMSIIESFRPTVLLPQMYVNMFNEALRDSGIPDTVYVWCNCGVAHPPEAAHKGCGQYARIPFKSALPNP